MRLIAVYLLVAGLVVLSRPTPLSVNVGLVFVAIGEAIRIWAAGHLHKTVELVTSGPYRYTRNPLYLGRLLILTGLCVMARMPYRANFVLLALGYLVFFAYYLPRKERVEPARLREAHGEAYERYWSQDGQVFLLVERGRLGEVRSVLGDTTPVIHDRIGSNEIYLFTNR